MSEKVEVHPVQNQRIAAQRHMQSVVPKVVTMRAYEVYCHMHGQQEAMVTGGCRGGFSVGELIAFLYAHSFPKAEWCDRVTEAFRGMEL